MKTLSVDPNPKPAGGRGKAKGGPKANDCAVPGPSESAMPLERYGPTRPSAVCFPTRAQRHVGFKPLHVAKLGCPSWRRVSSVPKGINEGLSRCSDTAAASTAGRVNAKPSGQKEKAAPKRKPAAPSTKARSKNAAVNEEVDSPAPAPTVRAIFMPLGTCGVTMHMFRS